MSAIATMTGRLTAVPQLRFIPSGDAVASFTVAYTKRKFDKATNTWSDDGEALFMNVTAWKQLAEGAAEHLDKGDLVTVPGGERKILLSKEMSSSKSTTILELFLLLLLVCSFINFLF